MGVRAPLTIAMSVVFGMSIWRANQGLYKRLMLPAAQEAQQAVAANILNESVHIHGQQQCDASENPANFSRSELYMSVTLTLPRQGADRHAGLGVSDSA